MTAARAPGWFVLRTSKRGDDDSVTDGESSGRSAAGSPEYACGPLVVGAGNHIAKDAD